MNDLLSKVITKSTRKPGAWAWPANISRTDRFRYAAQYALSLADPVKDTCHMRHIVACMADPWLLTRCLDEPERSEWVSMMGGEAEPQLVASKFPEIDEEWRAAFVRLISSGQLAEDENGNWIRGKYFRPAGLSLKSPHVQRAAFVILMVRRLEGAG